MKKILVMIVIIALGTLASSSAEGRAQQDLGAPVSKRSQDILERAKKVRRLRFEGRLLESVSVADALVADIASLPHSPPEHRALILAEAALSLHAVFQRDSSRRAIDQALHLAESEHTIAQAIRYHVNYAAGVVYSEQPGEHERAEKFLSDALTLADSPVETSEVLLARGLFLLERRRLGDSEACFTQGLQTLADAGVVSSVTVGKIHVALGLLYGHQSKWMDADAEISFGLDMLRENIAAQHPEIANTLFVRGLIRNHIEPLELAEKDLRAALEITRSVWGSESYLTAKILNTLGQNRARARYFKDAADFYRLALEINERQGYPTISSARANLGILLGKLRRFSEGEELLRAALPDVPDPKKGVILDNLFVMVWAQERWREALDLLESAVSAQERELSTSWTFGDEERKHVLVTGTNHLLFRAISFHALRDRDAHLATESAAFALSLVVGRKGRVLRDRVYAYRARRAHSAPEALALRDRIASLRTTMAEIATPESPLDSAREAHLRELAKEERAAAKQLDGLIAHDPSIPRLATLDEIQGALPESAALLEYVRYHQVDPNNLSEPVRISYLVYVITKDRVAWRPLGYASDVQRQVALFHMSLGFRRQDAKAKAKALYDTLLAPVADEIRDKTMLLVSPDMDLYRIPFAALHDGRDYVLDRHSVHYVDTFLHIVTPHPRVLYSGEVLAVANPDGARLPGSKEEEGAIASVFERVTTMEDSAVKWGAFSRAAKQASVLHISTHARPAPRGSPKIGESIVSPRPATFPLQDSAEEAPFRSLLRARLHFADREVTAYEFAGLDLDGAELVTLSACDTGLGRLLAAQGTLGFRYATELAGAASQLITLWRISDEETPLLMEPFYRHLAAGRPRHEALRLAQQELKSRSETEHPYHWGAFVMSGAWGPLEGDYTFEKSDPPQHSRAGCTLASVTQQNGMADAAYLSLLLVLLTRMPKKRPSPRGMWRSSPGTACVGSRYLRGFVPRSKRGIGGSTR